MIMTNQAWEKLNLSDLFNRFALYFKKQAEAGAYEESVYTGQEDTEVNRYYECEQQRINEGGTR